MRTVFEIVLGIIGALVMVATCKAIEYFGGSFDESMLMMILIQVAVHNAKFS